MTFGDAQFTNTALKHFHEISIYYICFFLKLFLFFCHFRYMSTPCCLGGSLLRNKHSKIKSSWTHVCITYIVYIYRTSAVCICTGEDSISGRSPSAVQVATQPPMVVERMLSLGLSHLNSIQPASPLAQMSPLVGRT